MELVLRVEGLQELQRSLRAMSDETPKVIQAAHKEVAQIVVPVAQRNAASFALAARIDARGTVKGAAIRFRGHVPRGKSRTTDALLQEFGGRAPLFGDKNHWYQVKVKNPKGYIIYPAIRETRSEVERLYLSKLDEAIRVYWVRG